MQAPSIGIYHDKRFKLANGLYPIKISVTFTINGKHKQLYFGTGCASSPADFERIIGNKARTTELKEISRIITTLKAKALEIVKTNPFVTPDLFKSLFTGKYVSTSSLKYFFELKIKQHRDRNTTQGEATAISYTGALKVIQEYSPNGLLLSNIDKDWLNGFEHYLHEKQYSITSIAIFMRYIRAAFNLAMEQRVVPHDIYPFGKKKYQIPQGNNIKKTLNDRDLHKLLNHQPKEPWKAKHLLFWKLCYYCVGMNYKDMALLKPENISAEFITYYRQKTASTRRTQKPIILPIHPKARKIINALAVPGAEYVFDIISSNMSPAQQYKTITNWRRNGMNYVKQIAAEIGVNQNIVIYTARHTSANNLLTNNIDLATLQDLLGHTSLASTQHYTAGLPFNKKKEMIIKAL